MKSKIVGLLTVGSLMCLPAMASTVVVDSFVGAVQLFANASSASPTVGSGVTDSNAIGGSRYVEASLTSGTLVGAGVNADVFYVSTTSSSTGNARVLWDGDTDPTNSFGLNVDLTDGGLNSVFRIAFRSNSSQGMSMVVYTDSANYSTVNFSSPGLGLDSYSILEIPFVSFAATGTGADFANVRAIQLFAAAPVVSYRLQLGYIETAARSLADVPTLIADLIEDVIALNLDAGISNAVDSKLQNALDALDRSEAGDSSSAIGILYALINSVEAQRGKKLTDAQADQLIAATQVIIGALSQP